MASSYSLSPYDNVGSGITRSGALKFPNPWFDIASEYVPSEINAVFDWCVPPGTLVDLDMYGRVAAIENIKVGDKVLSDDSRTYPVERAGLRQVSEDIVRIKAGSTSGHDLRLTKDHPLLVWRPKSTLKPNRLNFNKADSEKSYIKAGELKKGDWVCRPRPVFEETTRNFPYSTFIVGMYIAEGCLIKRDLVDGLRHPRGVQFTLGSHEAELILHLSRELQDYCGREVDVYRSPDRPDIVQIRIFDPELAVWLQTNIGELCHNKRLPELVFHLPVGMRMELLGAWIDGDGYVRSDLRLRNGNISALSLSSCSFELLYQAVILAQSCGLNPSICQRKDRPTPGGFSESQDITQIVFNVEDTRTLLIYVRKAKGRTASEEYGRGNNTYMAGNMIWKKIEAISVEHYDGKVYSLKVETSHNYLINNMLCHNCEYLYLSMGTYRSASRKVVRYFLTEILLDGESEDERDKMKDLLDNQLHLLTELAQIGDDYSTYGNVFVSVYFPFERFLICPKCKIEMHIDRLDFTYKSMEGAFMSKCHKCGYRGAMTCDDRRSPDKSRIKIIRWNPKQMHLKHHPVSGRTVYYWDIPPRFTERIVAGDQFYVKDTPMSILKCLTQEGQKKSGGQPLYEFRHDSIYHFKESTLAGLPVVGWGIPPIMPNFKLAYYIQVLRRYDEAIAMDFIVPFRILHPTVGATPQADAVLSSNLAEFRGHMLRMVSERRRDPTNVQVAPFPIGYQMIGGEAKSIAPKESIKFAVEELLNALGYPAELYMGTLNLQSAPVALRLFEKTWGSMVDGYNDMTSWIVQRICRNYMLGEMDAKLRSVTLADDLERKALQMQAAAGMDISKTTAYAPFGIQYMDEQKKIIAEQTKIQKLQGDAQAEQQAQQLQGSGTEGGQGQQGGQPPGESPSDIYTQGQELAKNMLFSMPDTLRRSELIKLKSQNPTLHALVIQFMGEMRQGAATQGQSSVLEQGRAAVAQGQPPPV